MKNIILYALSAIVITISACNNSMQLPSKLVGCWLESNRENDTVTMRHCADYTPGPARHFYRFILNEDGDGTYFYLSPTDAHRDIPIRWKAENNILIIRSELVDQRFSIKELTKTTLKLTVIHE